MIGDYVIQFLFFKRETYGFQPYQRRFCSSSYRRRRGSDCRAACGPDEVAQYVKNHIFFNHQGAAGI
jgi:hypothetical protein